MQGNLQRFVRFHFKQGLKRSLEVYKEQGSPSVLPILWMNSNLFRLRQLYLKLQLRPRAVISSFGFQNVCIHDANID